MAFCRILNVFFCDVWFAAQSISTPGSGIWSDGKDKSDGSQAHTWNVEVLIDVVKEVVSITDLNDLELHVLNVFPFSAGFISYFPTLPF